MLCLIVVDVIIVEVAVVLPDVEMFVLLVEVRIDVVKEFVNNFLVNPVTPALVTELGIFLDCFELIVRVLWR